MSVQYPGRVFRISSDGVDRMEAKIKTKKNPWTKIYPSPRKESLLKSSHPKKYLPNFPTQKISESKISNPKKSFDHPLHLKSVVPS